MEVEANGRFVKVLSLLFVHKCCKKTFVFWAERNIPPRQLEISEKSVDPNIKRELFVTICQLPASEHLQNQEASQNEITNLTKFPRRSRRCALSTQKQT